MATQIKITQLTNIGSANIAGTTLLPVVNMTGVPTTQKTTLGNLANVILSQAGGNYAAAGTANIAYSVANAAQPNITSVGTLTNVTVSGNVTGGVLSVTGNANIGNIGTGGLITVTGNVTAGNLVTGGVLTATGNATVGNLTTAGLASVTTLSVGSTANLGAVGNIKIAGGTSGYVLRTDGAGNLSWVAQAGGGGSPGGATTQVQFNDAGSFGGNAGFTFNKSTGGLALPGDLTGPASANFTIYSNAGVHDFIFGSDGTFYAPDNVVLSGNSISIGPGADALTGLERAVLVASSDHFAYIQGVIHNVSDNGSADWVAQGARGDDGGGWADLGFTSSGFNDADYTITGNGDGYVFVEGYATGQTLLGGGGNLVLATGNQGTTKDIIFGTSGFLTGNIFGRISHANNALELSRTSSNLNLSGGGNINFNGGGITQVINQELNIVVQDEEDDGWSIFNTITDGAGTGLSQTQLDSGSFTIATAPSGTTHSWGFSGNTLQVSSDSQIRSFGSNIALQSMSSGTGGTASLQSISNTNDPNIFTTFDATTTGANISVYDGGSNGGTGYTWQFANDGTTRFPANTLKAVNGANAAGGPGTAGAPLTLTAGTGGIAATGFNAGAGGDLTINAGDAGSNIGNQSWGEVGGDLVLRGGNATGPYVGGNVAIYSGAGPTAPGAISLYTGTNQWIFDATGNLTIPGSLINDTSVILSAPSIFNICTISNAGSGYNTGSSLKATTGGSGTGMTVGIGYGLSNQLTSVSVVDPGTGYVNGDVITVSEGTGGTFIISKYNESANQTNDNTVQTDFIFANSTVTLPIYGEIATDASMTLTTNLADTGNTSSWIFGDDGKLTFPGTPRIDTADDNFEVQAAEAINFEANTVVNIYTDSSDNAYQWQFGDDGNLTLPNGGSLYSLNSTPSGNPGNTIILQPAGSGVTTDQRLLVYPTAGDGDHIHLTSGNLYQTELFLGSDNLFVKLANTGNIVLNTNDSAGNTAMWTFDTAGNLTLPSGGNISATGNITANYFLGNGSQLTNLPAPAVAQDITSAGAMSIMTYDGNLKYVNYATVEPVTGNIAGGNISTSGIVTATGNITGGNLLTGGLISSTGNITGGNISTTGNISGNTNGFAIGYLNIPQVAASNTTIALTDAGKHYYSTSAGNFTLTIPNNATTSFATGTAISIVVQSTGNVLVNAASSVTLYMAGNSTAANRVVSNYGMATLMKVATDTWMINGTGVA